MRIQTTHPVQPGNTSGILPEFGRTPDVTHLYGLRRGSLYNLLKQGLIKGVVLRVMGKKSGVRLWHLASVREYILKQMANS